jgi:hypothetical protein
VVALTVVPIRSSRDVRPAVLQYLDALDGALESHLPGQQDRSAAAETELDRAHAALASTVASAAVRVGDVADWRTGTLRLPAGVPKGAPVASGRTAATSSRLLYDVIGAIYDWVGFDVVDDEVFRDLVIARIVGADEQGRFPASAG